nr:hypothetical protein Itr_chr08CG15610 [Ipomoea trifida]
MRNLFQMSKGEELGLSSRRCRRVRNWRPTVEERPVEVGDSVEHLVDGEVGEGVRSKFAKSAEIAMAVQKDQRIAINHF